MKSCKEIWIFLSNTGCEFYFGRKVAEIKLYSRSLCGIGGFTSGIYYIISSRIFFAIAELLSSPEWGLFLCENRAEEIVRCSKEWF